MVRQSVLTAPAVTLLALLASLPANAASDYQSERQWQGRSSEARSYDATRSRDASRRWDNDDDGWQGRNNRATDARGSDRYREAYRHSGEPNRWNRGDDRWDGRRHYRDRWHHHRHGHWWRRWWWYD